MNVFVLELNQWTTLALLIGKADVTENEGIGWLNGGEMWTYSPAAGDIGFTNTCLLGIIASRFCLLEMLRIHKMSRQVLESTQNAMITKEVYIFIPSSFIHI